MSKTMHIVSFDYPYPPNYGGIIDVFYKIKALRHSGINIILHYFADEEKKDNAMDALCKKIWYYPKNSVMNRAIFSDIPLRMFLRSNRSILRNLSEDNFPILFEGLHASFIATSPELKYRRMYLRCHNAEAEYAANMADSEEKFFKRKAFRIEARRTAEYEKKLHHFSGLFVLTEKDRHYFADSNNNIHHLPAFHQDNGIEEPENLGDYLLFHGNLSINENVATARWIINKIAPKFWDFNFIIAGKDPDRELIRDCELQNITCISNPNQQRMDQLIRDSQIILLKTAVPSGIKLKLIDSLAKGRHVIADENSVISSGLEDLVHIANTDEEVVRLIRLLMHKKVEPEMLTERSKTFSMQLNNEINAQKLINEVFGT